MANSIFKTYEVTVDTMKDSSVPQNMRYSQNDLKSAKILINVNHDGNEEDFSEAIAVRVSFEKSDKKIVYQDCQPINVMKGKYQVLLTTQTLTSVGIVTAHIHIYFPNDKKVETGSFTFEVVESKMSDEVIESTDSFTVIQKAIEVGEKFQNVDFNPIIAAGALAQGALPKTGGTMSGNIEMDTAVGNKSKGIRWKDATGTLFGIESSTTGELILYDYKNAARVWQYDPVAKRFTVLSDSNLLKTTGGTVTGSLTLGNELRFEGSSVVQQMLFKGDGTTTKTVWLAKSQEGIVVVAETAPGSGSRDWSNAVYLGGNQNGVVKKTGDTMTGNLVMSNDRGVFYQNKAGSSVLAHKIDVTDVFSLRDVVNGRNVYTVTGNDFIVNYNLKTAKDGQVNLTITADGTEFDAGTPSVARRRGNSVTLRIALRRNVGSADSIVATIPADMRPSTFMVTNAVSTDGTVVRLTVEAAGNIKLSAPGKDVYATITYVVD